MVRRMSSFAQLIYAVNSLSNKFRVVCAALLMLIATATLVAPQAQAVVVGVGGNKPYFNSMNGVRLKVLVEPQSAPFAILHDNVAHPVGFDIDVMYDLQRRLGFQLVENRFFPVDVRQGFDMLYAHDADMLIGGLVASDKHAKNTQVTDVIYSSGLSIIYSNKHAAVESPSDISENTKIGVKHSSSAEEYIRGVTKANPKVYNNIIMAYYEVSTGEIDAVVADRPSLKYFEKLIPVADLKVSESIFDVQSGQIVFYLSKHFEYKDVINKALKDMQTDGTIYRLRKKWNLDS